MTFLAPLFLLGALAAAVPVLLHMVNRQRAKELPFATLRFLRVSVQKTRRKRRVQDLFLMIVRAAVLLLIALGLARPTVTNISSLLGGRSSAVAIVLDNSASMAAIDSGKTRFETALHAVDQILEALQDGDQVALFLTGEPPFPEQGKLDGSRDAVLQMLNHCAQRGPSYERADLGIRIEQARRVLAEAVAPNKQIYVITDQQKHSWDGLKDDAAGSEGPEAMSAELEKLRKIPVIVVDCSREPEPNAAIQQVSIDAAAPVAGVPLKASVELYNADSRPWSRRVELFLDDAKEASSPEVSIDATSRATHVFNFTLKRGGAHRGEVRLVGQDGSAADDRRYFTIEVDQGVPVAIVTPRRHEIPYLDESFYVQQALAPGHAGGSAIRSTVLEAKDLATEPLAAYTVVYCVDLEAPTGAAAEALHKYVQGGGHLVWIAGANVQPDAYNQMNDRAGKELLPAPLLDVRSAGAGGRDSWHLGSIDPKHRALEHLAEPPSLYQSVLVYQHVRIDAPPASGAWVLARLDDQEPLLVQKKLARGSLTMLGTSAHVGWTNLPLRPIFLPLLTRLTFDLAGLEQTSRNGLAGSSLVLPFDNETQPIHVEVIPPSGTQIRLPTKAEPGQPGQVFRYSDTYDLGFYNLRPLEGSQTRPVVFAVNVDPDEALADKIDAEELRRRFGTTEVVFADNPDDLSGTFKMLREGKSLWTPFLALVLAALVFETFVSNRFSAKQEEDPMQKAPPGMRRPRQHQASEASGSQ
jgi:hypothetical protein